MKRLNFSSKLHHSVFFPNELHCLESNNPASYVRGSVFKPRDQIDFFGKK
jgi:hypothetical protein